MHSSLLRKRLNDQCRSVSFGTTDSPTSSCPSTPPMSARWIEPPTIDFCVMEEKHQQDVFQLINDTFFRDEPLNRCLAFDLPNEPIEFTQFVLSRALEDQCSFVAIDIQTEKIIGVILNLIKHRQSDSKEFQSEKLRFIFGIFKSLHRKIDLFEALKSDRLLHVVIIAIDSHYRGLRLTEKLIRASLERAKSEFHLHAAFSEATSLYSSKAFRKQGFQIYDEILYTQYDQSRLASLTGEHDRCQLLGKQL